MKQTSAISQARPMHRSKRRRQMPKGVPPISTLPTLMTLGNVLCGFAAIHYASKPVEITSIFGWSSLTVAGLLIFLGMFFDSIDGTIARLTKSTSEVVEQLPMRDAMRKSEMMSHRPRKRSTGLVRQSFRLTRKGQSCCMLEPGGPSLQG